MIDIHLDIPADDLNAVIEKLRHTAPLMQEVSQVMWASVLENFEQAGRPRWALKRDGTQSRLVDSGRLKASITRAHDNTLAVVGTNVEYAPIHHFGGVIKPKTAKALKLGNRFAKKVTIPARPFLMLTPDDEKEIEYTVQDYLSQL